MNRVKIFFVRFLVVLLAFQSAAAAQLINISSAHASEPSVVINELMWMGSTASSSDEWIELRNPTNAPIDISGWQLTNTATSGGTLTVPSEKSIPANGYFLISNFNENSASSILNIAPDWTTTSVSLANACVPIDLKTGSGTVVDSMGCNDGDYFFPALAATKHSLERNIVIADGLLGTSWHESVGFANLDLSASPSNLATPKFANDVTPPTIGQVTDDGQFTANPNQLRASWSGFADNESGIASYKAGVGTIVGTNDVASLTDVGLLTSKTFDFSGSPLLENTTYYINVSAVNGVGLTSPMASSNGITVNTVNPAMPTGLTITDVPSDNGGSLKALWSASTSLDQITYQLNYRKVGEVTWTSVSVDTALEKTVTGLLNAPTSYEFTVEAIDFNAQHSTKSAIVSGQALDNLAPIIDATKIVLTQNKPGNEDTIFGESGLSNEPNITAYIFYQDPSLTVSTPTPMTIGASGGFTAALGIGDNTHDKVWVRLFDGTNLSVSSPVFINDIVGPTAPILNQATTSCESASCHVTLNWQAGSPDTTSYRVTYNVDGADHQTFEVTTVSMTLDLASGRSYQFKVIGYDKAGNPSPASNVFSLALTRGVKTTVVLVNGQPVTTTEAISGSVEVKSVAVRKSKAAPAQFVPKVKAAEPVVETPTAPTAPLVANTATNSSRDWVRILVVVVLLLIIAGSFYALSRSVQETPEEELDKKAEDLKNTAITGTAKRRRRYRRRQK